MYPHRLSQLSEHLREQLARARFLQGLFDSRALRLAGLYEKIDRARHALESEPALVP